MTLSHEGSVFIAMRLSTLSDAYGYGSEQGAKVFGPTC